MKELSPTEIEEIYTKAEGGLGTDERITRLHRRLKRYAGLVEFLTEELATSNAALELFILAVRNCDPSVRLVKICDVAEEELGALQQRLMAEMLDPEDAQQQARN